MASRSSGGRVSPAAEERARQVGMRYVYRGHIEKIPILEENRAASGITLDEISYRGDDLTDAILMRRVGLAIATPDARPEVKQIAPCVTAASGGRGAVGEICELPLKTHGRSRRRVAPV